MTPPPAEHLWQQIVWLFALAIPVSCVAWTVTHEEVFREPREYCQRMSRHGRTLPRRKFFYLFTCEYCFSHYVTVAFLILTQFKFLLDDWRGYILSFFAVVWVSNLYMSRYNRLRVDINAERANMKEAEQGARVQAKEAEVRERQLQKLDNELEQQKAN